MKTKNVTIYILAILFAIGLLVLTAQSLSAESIVNRTDPSSKSITPEPILTKSNVIEPTTPTIERKLNVTQSKPNVVEPKTIKTERKVTESKAVSCPQGTRPTGGGGCKIEPTGCYLDEQTPLEECKGI